jgi:hypothetical protein
MKKRSMIIVSILCCVLFSATMICSKEKPMSQQGTISMVLELDKAYTNGKWEYVFTQNLVEIPGIGNCIFERDYTSVSIQFQWEQKEAHKGFFMLFTEIPGPREYSIIFTWDADKGKSNMYINGISARLENPKYYVPWKMKGKSLNIRIPKGPIQVKNVKLQSRYLPKEEIQEWVPKELMGKSTCLLGKEKLPPPINVKKRLGKLLYFTKMNNQESMKDWVLEGPAKISFENNMMILKSQIPNPPDVSTGHFNYWCNKQFPDNFIAEWEFKPLKEKGLVHIFFAAKGIHGEDIFDSALPKRDGHYSQYHSGGINCYYLIFYSNRRLLRTTNLARSHLNKATPQRTLNYAQIAITPGPEAMKFHRLRLIKDSGHIQLQVDGQVYLDFTDTGDERWGPVFGEGKISFRQLAVTEAAYRNFTAWELK